MRKTVGRISGVGTCPSVGNEEGGQGNHRLPGGIFHDVIARLAVNKSRLLKTRNRSVFAQYLFVKFTFFNILVDENRRQIHVVARGIVGNGGFAARFLPFGIKKVRENDNEQTEKKGGFRHSFCFGRNEGAILKGFT